jgi:hypothetical protein
VLTLEMEEKMEKGMEFKAKVYNRAFWFRLKTP